MTDPFDQRADRPERAAGVADPALEEVNRLWTIVRAFTNTAHDINNALQVISGSAELLEGRALDPAVRRRIETIRTQANQAAGGIGRLLTYARAVPSHPQGQDIWPILDAAVAMRMASANRAHVVMTLGEAGPRPCRVVVDGARTLQALLGVLLAAEQVVARRPHARVGVDVAIQGGMVNVNATAVADGEASGGRTDTDPDVAAVTADATLWVAGRLVASQGGALDIAAVSGGRRFTLKLRPA